MQPTKSALGAKSDFRSEEHTSELQSRFDLVCRLLLEKKKTIVKSRVAGHELTPMSRKRMIASSPSRQRPRVLLTQLPQVLTSRPVRLLRWRLCDVTHQ